MKTFWLILERPAFIISRRGNPMIEYQDNKFSYNKSSIGKNPKKRWVCTRWAVGCRAFILTIDDIIIKKRLNHSH
ncbi:hypothetical protein HF086_014302 [Spodoptera exigua]|uniref:FLYWCH-type domain-containing protein n=1 Tax=Spodoptera exigua TaxID=7107 RepID=A0A922SBA4_SPOEX|nr:hypothetical protein HF086_014302 [Spodoptera exigua]